MEETVLPQEEVVSNNENVVAEEMVVEPTTEDSVE